MSSSRLIPGELARDVSHKTLTGECGHVGRLDLSPS